MNRRKAVFALLLVCAAALFVNMRWVDSQTRAAEARSGGNIVDTNVLAANVRIEGSGPTIVLIHGFGAAMDWWDDIAPELAIGHRVIRVDLIGHGGTEAPNSGYSIPRQAALVSAILDQLGVGQVTVIGHSMGGEVATALAEIKPERVDHMILIDTPPSPGGSFSMAANAYFEPVLGELLSHFRSDEAIRRGLAQGFAPGFPIQEKFVADFKQLTYYATRMAHHESVSYRESIPTYQRIAALRPLPPLLVIFGSLDAMIPAEKADLFSRVPGAKVVMIEGSGHSPMVEAPAKTLGLIQDFLRSTP